MLEKYKRPGRNLKLEPEYILLILLIYYRALSRFRVKVENVLGQIKVFKIMSERYRNKRKRYNIKFKIIAEIVNLKNGFATA